ncbi:MAG TPA: S1 RNA-binding domain-containing protein [Acidimicrobiales bacterium]|nr:S1 RNA-binding domain-containing protein [Acidimicrobiales bacterium]
MPFIEFVAAHPVGTAVEGEVERFSSHGCYLISDGARCYLSLKLMGDPAPTSPKEVVSLGETLSCVVISIDTPRRGIDLALPGFVPDSAEGAAHSTRSQRNESEEDSLSTRKAVKKKKAPAKKAPAKRKAPAKKAPAKRKAPAKKAPAKRKAPAKKAPAKKR